MSILALTDSSTGTISGIKVLLGKEAESRLASKSFIKKWDALYENCPWATVFQSSKLLTTWFQCFKDAYHSILIFEEQEDKLTGLLILVQDIGKSKISVAGCTEAEYQTWLAEGDQYTGFIENALTSLRSHFPKSEVHFTNIPANTPLEWVSRAKWSKVCELTAFQRPVMNLNKADAPKLFRKQQFREKRNRLKRLGELSFEHITSLDRFVTVLPELMDQFDFRKGARYNVLYFRNKPAGKRYLIELFKQGLLHATILKLNDEIIASIVGQIDGKSVCLGGINTHSPCYGLLSPGYVHFLMLGQHLLAEGYELFDLTPGNDPYKWRIANDQDVVHSLCFSSPKKTFVKKRVVNPLMDFAKANLSKRGVDIRDLKETMLKALERINKNKVNGMASIITSILPYKRNNKQTAIYRYDPSSSVAKNSVIVELNSFASLLDFDQHSSRITRWEFLNEAMQRFENGAKAHTYVKNGRLLCCVWQAGNTEVLENVLGAEALDAQQQHICLVDGFYLHAALQANLESVIKSIMEKVKAGKQSTCIYATLSGSDKKLGRELERAGFKPLI
ncbi:GNAT family N-acetyltransferase [Pontibacter oryzae]|nr:GNAT family N-acetyltransferase [Pontibacter oryzae]